MRTTIDRAGRVVVPKAFRERLGLRAGQEVELEETDVGLLLVPAVSEPRIVDAPGGPVVVPAEGGQGGVVVTDEVVRALLEAGRP
ncbi:MAG: AbrB/MazE/SpoVT family DNA-binding domain-containing protein [Acidimicrobiales bacterium]